MNGLQTKTALDAAQRPAEHRARASGAGVVGRSGAAPEGTGRHVHSSVLPTTGVWRERSGRQARYSSYRHLYSLVLVCGLRPGLARSGEVRRTEVPHPTPPNLTPPHPTSVIVGWPYRDHYCGCGLLRVGRQPVSSCWVVAWRGGWTRPDPRRLPHPHSPLSAVEMSGRAAWRGVALGGPGRTAERVDWRGVSSGVAHRAPEHC